MGKARRLERQRSWPSTHQRQMQRHERWRRWKGYFNSCSDYCARAAFASHFTSLTSQLKDTIHEELATPYYHCLRIILFISQKHSTVHLCLGFSIQASLTNCPCFSFFRNIWVSVHAWRRTRTWLFLHRLQRHEKERWQSHCRESGQQSRTRCWRHQTAPQRNLRNEEIATSEHCLSPRRFRGRQDHHYGHRIVCATKKRKLLFIVLFLFKEVIITNSQLW